MRHCKTLRQRQVVTFNGLQVTWGHDTVLRYIIEHFFNLISLLTFVIYKLERYSRAFAAI